MSGLNKRNIPFIPGVESIKCNKNGLVFVTFVYTPKE